MKGVEEDKCSPQGLILVLMRPDLTEGCLSAAKTFSDTVKRIAEDKS